MTKVFKSRDDLSNYGEVLTADWHDDLGLMVVAGLPDHADGCNDVVLFFTKEQALELDEHIRREALQGPKEKARR